MDTRFRDFIRTFVARWFIAMTGPLSVPLAIGGSFATQDVLRIGLFLTSISCVIFSSYWAWREERIARRKAERIVYHPFVDIAQSCIFCDPKNESWKAEIGFLQTVGPMRICLTVQTYLGGIGQHIWGNKTRWPLRGSVCVGKGEKVSIDLMALDNSSPAHCWCWSSETTDVNTLILQTCHRCQLVFMPEKGRHDYFDFYVSFHDGVPSLIGEHLFLYARAWKNDDAL
jgi:hypothetical protein